MVTYMLRIEGVNLYNFVGDSQDLNTIRGGGLILLNAIERIRQQLPSPEKISTGASSGLFELQSTDEIEQIRKSIDDLLNEDGLKHATIVCDIIERTTDFLHDKECLITLNRWRQMQSPSVAVPNPNDVNEGICSIDHLRPAATFYVTPEGIKEPISRSALVRRSYGQNEKQKFYQKLMDEKSSEKSFFTLDFDELTSDKRRNLDHKMAVIYIDGNDFGKIQREHCTSREALQKFDTQVQAYRREFLCDLIREMRKIPENEADRYRWKTTGDKLRIETLLWGGDEMVWAVPAWNGWKTLSHFYQKSKDWQFDGVALRHAAGIVFCHHNAPIHRIKRLAQDLAELAKAKSREANLFAYEVLESFDHVSGDLESYRRRRSPGGNQAGSLILDGTKMQDIETLAPVILENLSRRQLNRLVRMIIQPEPPDNEERSKTLRNLTAELTIDQVTQLRDALGGDDVSWVHLLSLWDYLV